MHPMILIVHRYREKNRESFLAPVRNRQAMVQRNLAFRGMTNESLRTMRYPC
jgi:hypothetical protein